MHSTCWPQTVQRVPINMVINSISLQQFYFPTTLTNVNNYNLTIRMTRTLEKCNFQLRKQKKFTILHNEDSILRQVKVAQNKIPLISPVLQRGIESYLAELSQKIRTAVAATSNGKIPLSYDYVLLAETCTSSLPDSFFSVED